jgi:GWxTD domain-containing protein
MTRAFFIAFICLASSLLANVTVYFNYAVFSSPTAKPYLETYLTISGNTVKYSPVNGGNQASVNISWRILKGTDATKEIVKTSSYNLLSPKVSDSLQMPSFIDNQRFSLPNGQYTLEFTIIDNAFPDKKTTHSEKITIDFKRDKKIYSSDIQILESFTKTNSPSTLSKNGYDLIPYTINYYPKTQHSLKFYYETYNADSLLGKASKFIYIYYIENSETSVRQNSFSGFQKQTSQKVNPLLNQFDITQLPTGNYNLVIEVKDSLNNLQSQKKWFFQRQSDAVDHTLTDKADNNLKTIEEFFNLFQSKDTLKQFIECLWPRSTTKEREWQQVQIVKKDPNLMRSYCVDYWKKEAGDSLDPLKIWITYYKSVLETNALMKCGKQKGYYTDRGRVYLQYGKPNQRSQVNSEPNTYPYEIWQYYRIYDKATGRFFTNKKFIFVNFAISDNCYQLIHSDVRGEVYDERWRFRLTTRSQQSSNIDDTQPANTYGGNVDDNFNNPR